MNYNEIKLSDVTKALRKAGYKAVKLDLTKVNPFPGINEGGVYYKYNGSLYIQGKDGNNVGFSIMAKSDPCCCGYKYATSAIDAAGAASESLTNWPQLFFPRLFGYLAGEISEAEIIAEICA